MNKYRIIPASVLVLCCVLGISFIACQNKTNNSSKINILFVMGDQHRGDCLGVDGATWLQTPNLDKLAHEGVLFKNAYASVPSCLAARTSILTGMSPWQSGQLGYKPIADYPYEMPQMFTDAGYRTHAVGKNHFTPMRHKHGYQTVELEEAWYSSRKGMHAIKEENRQLPFPDDEKCDYTLWFEQQMPGVSLNQSGLGYVDHRGGRTFPFADTLHPTYWTAERAIHFLENYEEKAPWLLKVSFQRPHPPFDPPKNWLEKYGNIKIPETMVGQWAEEKYKDATGLLEESPNVAFGKFPGYEIEAARRAYYASISFLDEQLGRVLDALEKRGELENTLIIYTSDHGDMMGDHHMWRKCRPYEGSVRIPMIMRWPEALHLKSARGQIRNELVELRDLLPTFLDAAGLQKPQVMDGESMFGVFRDTTWRQVLDLEHARFYEKDNSWVALTDGRYKYIYFTLSGQQQLFDLSTDPYEMYNLAEDSINGTSEELLYEWRKKMVMHLEPRGEYWVKNGELTIQEHPVFYGRNHPTPEN